MGKFNRGKPYHGSQAVTHGKLRGSTDTDYFYFFCPRCPDDEIMRALEYGLHINEPGNPYDMIPEAKGRFSIVFKIHCQKCGITDFVKIGNVGWQGGKRSETLRAVSGR